MTLDDRSRLLHPKHRTGECLRQTGYKEAILIDLLEIIGEDENYKSVAGSFKTSIKNKLRQELRDKVRKYCK